MSDNLAHKLNIKKTDPLEPTPSHDGNVVNRSQEAKLAINKQETGKNRTVQKLQKSGRVMERIGRTGRKLGVGAQAIEKGGRSLTSPIGPGQKNMAQSIAQAKNIAINRTLKKAKNKALSGDIKGSVKELTKFGGHQSTRWILTTLWGSVWLDWTFLSLIGLNIMLVGSLFLPNVFCQFGEDYLIGKWIPSKELAKYTEIILLMIINTIIAGIIILFIYMIYSIYNCGISGYISIFLAGVLPGGETATSQTFGCIIK